MRRAFFPRAALFFSMTVLLAACGSTGGGSGTTPAPSANRQLSFGVDMARQELWSEALFRFHQAEALDPQNPRIHNNLAVAYEATGDFENALKHYQQALRLDPNNRDLRANWTRFSQFYSAFTQQKRAQAGQPGQPVQPGAAPTPPPSSSGAATPPTIGQPGPTPSLAQPPQTAPVQPPVDSQPDQNPPPPPPPAMPAPPATAPGTSPSAADPSNALAVP